MLETVYKEQPGHWSLPGSSPRNNQEPLVAPGVRSPDATTLPKSSPSLARCRPLTALILANSILLLLFSSSSGSFRSGPMQSLSRQDKVSHKPCSHGPPASNSLHQNRQISPGTCWGGSEIGWAGYDPKTLLSNCRTSGTPLTVICPCFLLILF